MRKAGLAVALVATTQLTLLSSFSGTAFAEDSLNKNGPINLAPSGSASAAPAAATAPAPEAPPAKDDKKITTGWVLVGVGGVLGITGIIVNIVGANSGHVAGAGGAGDNDVTDNTRTDLYFLGTTLLVAGVATGVYGGALVWSGNNGTDTKASEHKTDDDAKADSVTKVAAARFATAPSFVVPIIGATF
jgi:hypothetical protein